MAELPNVAGYSHTASVSGLPSGMIATLQMLFAASQGNLQRVQHLAKKHKLDITKADKSCDYDQRTALHLSASEGAFAVTDWLVKNSAPVNAVDRFNLTPLACAAYGCHTEVIKLLKGAGGLVYENGSLIPIGDSMLAAADTGGKVIRPVTAGPGTVNEPKIIDLVANPEDQFWNIDHSELIRSQTIGEGAFGVVYAAKWRGTLVAVKELRSSLIADKVAEAEFRSELGLMRKLHHPHIVQFLGTTVNANGNVGVITEKMEKGLDRVFATPSPLATRQALNIFVDCARGLAYLHAHRPQPVIHRDLKPSNLMLTKSGKLKIGDFGLSRTLAVRNDLPVDMTQSFKLTGETGSYRYMAPEVFRHEMYGPPVDVYAMSMIAYQMFTWSVPFDGTPPVEAARNAALSNFRPTCNKGQFASDVSDAMPKMLERMWSPESHSRPSTLQIVEELELMIDNLGPAPDKGAGQDGCCSVQ